MFVENAEQYAIYFDEEKKKSLKWREFFFYGRLNWLRVFFHYVLIAVVNFKYLLLLNWDPIMMNQISWCISSSIFSFSLCVCKFFLFQPFYSLHQPWTLCNLYIGASQFASLGYYYYMVECIDFPFQYHNKFILYRLLS